MDMDINNRAALQAGADQHYTQGEAKPGWRSMESAPRDGSIVELKNSYGVAPHYGLYRWTCENLAHSGEDGGLVAYTSREPSWVEVKRGGGPFSEHALKWRPYEGDPDAYRDPTAGLQDSAAYWRGASAASLGRPITHFEAVAARNAAKLAPLPPARADNGMEVMRSWLSRLWTKMRA